MKREITLSVLVVALVAVFILFAISSAPPPSALAGAGPAASPGPGPIPRGEYRVLDPLQSGNLTLFPVVRTGSNGAAKWEYLTLDEGLRSGEVEVTEYGRLRGMVRHRHPQAYDQYRGDRVNTLVLVNNSDKPLILLAGEIVTGGKQDRVIGKDRIVEPHSDPIDLSVFCIEHGRWTESSETFGVSATDKTYSFMVQPSVRTKAMVEKDQQQVWDTVAGAVDSVHRAAVEASPAAAPLPAPSTTSYAKAMKMGGLDKEVDRVAEPLTRSNHQLLQKLRDAHAVGVVVAVRGYIIWADVFATPEMLAAYWTKLVRSYAAESYVATHRGKGDVTRDGAERFINSEPRGTETSVAETGVYRYRQVQGPSQSTFYLEALLPGTEFDVHVSRVVENDWRAMRDPVVPLGGVE